MILITAITFFIILSVLVFIHEFGHYSVARFFGVHVEEFGLGLPPRAFGRKIGRTIYSLNWLPFGGFVKLAGEDEAEEHEQKGTVKGTKRFEYFWARSKKERAAILVAGVTMNFLLAVALTAFLLTQGVPEPSGTVSVKKVVEGSPAAAAGLLEGDVLVSIKEAATTVEPKKLTTAGGLISYVGDHKGKLLTFDVVRSGERFAILITPRVTYPVGQGPMGVAVSDVETRVYSLSEAPGKAVVVNLTRGRDMLVSLVATLYRLVTFQSVGGEVSGPIGIARVTGEAVKFGWKAVIEFMSILSLNLAVLNILPIPALDGGRLAFVFLEKILGKKVRPAFERNAHQIGMIILIGLILLVSISDIMKLGSGS